MEEFDVRTDPHHGQTGPMAVTPLTTVVAIITFGSIGWSMAPDAPWRSRTADWICGGREFVSKIYVIHENEAWIEPLAAAFAAQNLPWENWHLGEGAMDLAAPPPEGVFYNRMSASSHTRDHRYSAEYTVSLLSWLERHDRRVVNGSRALDLEINKVRQYTALERSGIRVPRTAAVLGKRRVADAARQIFGAGPVILKPNRGGKGLGVQLFQTVDALAAYLEGPAYDAPVDGVHLLQEYVRAPESFITRAEFIGGRFFYAVRVDTSGGFELCPADACSVDDAFCPVGERPVVQRPKFEIVSGIDDRLRRAYERFLAHNRVSVAGIEFITAVDGQTFTYDVNTNTNYNPEAERAAGKFAMQTLAAFLGRALTERGAHSQAAE